MKFSKLRLNTPGETAGFPGIREKVKVATLLATPFLTEIALIVVVLSIIIGEPAMNSLLLVVGVALLVVPMASV
jgi:hypothetical protein